MGAHEPVAHGALDHSELAALDLQPEDLLDFSSNINPFGPPPEVPAALAALDPAPYPDRSCRALRIALAAQYQVAATRLLVGNGANELIHLIARTFLQPEAVALAIGPTYGEYAHASRLAGARVIEVASHPGAAFQPDGEALKLIIARTRPQVIWLCSPNNPTGVAASADLIGLLHDQCAAFGGYLVLDRSYTALQRDPEAYLYSGLPQLIELHSLTKSYALAGLRLGYLLATPELVQQIGAYQSTWSVNSAAQAAGLAALRATTFLPTSIPQLWAASDALYADLTALGLPIRRGGLPFMLVQTGDGAATRAALLRRGCLVRDCASFGLPAWVRVAPRRPDANARLLEAWSGIVQHQDAQSVAPPLLPVREKRAALRCRVFARPLSDAVGRSEDVHHACQDFLARVPGSTA